jgi:hypothetical protein
MGEARPAFIWFIVVIVTIVFAFLYFSLPESIAAVDTGRHARFVRNPKFSGKQVNQRPLLIGVWASIALPLSAWGVVTMIRNSRGS